LKFYVDGALRSPLDGETVAVSQSVLNFAPSMICQRIKSNVNTEDCGYGATLGYKRKWNGDSGLFNIKLNGERIGLNLEYRF
jgi:hypothetical protein